MKPSLFSHSSTKPIQQYIFHDEALTNIFPFITMERDLQRCAQVCKKWNAHITLLNQFSREFCIKHNICGKDKFLKYFNTIGNVPRLPETIIQHINSPKWEDALFILHPQKVNGKTI